MALDPAGDTGIRKNGAIYTRLIETYRALLKIRSKDLPAEVRHDHEWPIGAIDIRSAIHLHAEIQGTISGMTPA